MSGLNFNTQQLIKQCIERDVRSWYGPESLKGCDLTINPTWADLEPRFQPLQPYTFNDHTSLYDLTPIEDQYPDISVDSYRLWFNAQSEIKWQDMEASLREWASIKTPSYFLKIGNEERISHYICTCRKKLEQVGIPLKARHPGIHLQRIIGHPFQGIPENHILSFVELVPTASYVNVLTGFDTKEDIPPLQSFDTFLSTLPKGCIGFLQVLMQGTKHPWKENISALVNAQYQLTKCDGHLFGDEEFFKQSKIKIDPNQPIISAIIRVGVFSSADKAQDIMEKLLQPLEKFQYGGQPLYKLHNQAFNAAGHTDETLRTMFYKGKTFRSGSLLTPSELTGIIHLPESNVLEMQRSLYDTYVGTTPSYRSNKEGLLLGYNELVGAITQDSNLQDLPIAIIGKIGKGKSLSAVHSAEWLAKNGHGFILIDPHGDAVTYLLDHIPEKRIQDTILIRPWLKDQVPCMNILAGVTDKEKYSDNFIVALRKQHGLRPGWQIIETILYNVVYGLLHLDNPCLTDIDEILTMSSRGRILIREIKSGLKNTQAANFWTYDLPKYKNDLRRAARVINRLTRNEKLSRMFSQRENRIDFMKAREEKKIILCDLSEGMLGAEASNILGCLILALVHQAGKAQVSIPPEKRTLFFVIVDEVQNFDTTITADSIRSLRKFKTPHLICTQTLSQLSEAAEAAVREAGSIIVFDLSWKDAERFHKEFCGLVPQHLFMRRKPGHALAMIGDHVVEFQTPAPIKEKHPDRVEAITQNSISKYYIHIDDIERQKKNLSRSIKSLTQIKAEFDEIDFDKEI